jgi:acid phosphatase
MGQLTGRGMRQELQRGDELRKKYIDQYHLLPAHYQNETMYVFATNFDRTLMSADSILLGLYTLGTGPRLSEKIPALPLLFQPIPVHTRPLESEPFIGDADPEKFNQQLTQYLYTQPQWIQKTQDLQTKLAVWNQATGLTLTNLHQLEALADALRIYKIHRIPLPTALSNADVKEIIAVGSWAFTTEYKTKEIAHLAGTPLLLKIADYLQTASQENTPLKYVLFVAHDSTVMSLLTTLGAPLTTPPPYAANVNVSLFRVEKGNYIVKVIYNGKPVVIPACNGTSCNLDQFTKLAGLT